MRIVHLMQIAIESSLLRLRDVMDENMTFGNFVYVPDTEFGGIIEDVLTDTSLDYVELKVTHERGRMEMKVIEPPSGSDYKTVSGELNAVLKN